MNHAQLKAFHAVAETGGFSAAAKMLGLTQPAVTFQIQALEQHYNTKLFRRRGRKTEITASGQLLLSISKRIFSLEQEAENLLASLASLEAGHLKIVATSSLSSLPLVSAFRARYPEILVSYRTIPSNAIETEIFDFRADIAIHFAPPKDKRLLGLKIEELPLNLAVSKDHPWAEKTSVELADLQNEVIILPFDLETMGRIRGHWSEFVQFERDQAFVLQNKETGREAVANGLGMTFFTDRDIRWDDRIHAIDVNDGRMKEATYMICLADERESPIIASFFNSAAGSKDISPAD